MQNAGGEGVVSHLRFRALQFRDTPGKVACCQTVGLQPGYIGLRQYAAFQPGKCMHTKNDGAHRFQAQHIHRMKGVRNLSPQAEERRIDHLEQLGGHSRVLRNDLAHTSDARLDGTHFFRDLPVQAGETGSRFQSRDTRPQSGIREQVHKRKSSGQPGFQFIGVAGLGHILVGRADGVENGFAV